MTLKECKAGNTYRVQSMQLPQQLGRRLLALGMLEGTPVTVMNNKRRGAVIVKVRGTRFAMGAFIAQNITVEELHNAE